MLDQSLNRTFKKVVRQLAQAITNFQPVIINFLVYLFKTLVGYAV
jgi:hypothetical protein